MSERNEFYWREGGDIGGAIHHIDQGGNYFIGRRCVNPKKVCCKRCDTDKIGFNYPSQEEYERCKELEEENRKV